MTLVARFETPDREPEACAGVRKPRAEREAEVDTAERLPIMARTTKTISLSSRTAKAAGPTRSTAGRKPVSKAATAKAVRRAPAAKAVAKAPGRTARPPAAASTPVQNKQELRQRIDKLERANVNLRIKNREATETARAQADRIDVLEEEIERLRAAAKPAAVAAKPASPATRRTARKRRETTDHDPGDAVPPGVAPLEAAPMDKEAEDAKRSLDIQLSAANASA